MQLDSSVIVYHLSLYDCIVRSSRSICFCRFIDLGLDHVNFAIGTIQERLSLASIVNTRNRLGSNINRHMETHRLDMVGEDT
jgi:hypothetical protein